MKEDEPIKIWKESGFELRLYDTHKRDEYGKHILAYKLYDYLYENDNYPVERHLIFLGGDFCCSPLHAIDSMETVISLLGFLSLMEGDTDQEYFDNYSQFQLDWRDSGNCENLQMVMYDLEEKYNYH